MVGTILINGCNGFIGRHLLASGVADEIVAVSRKSPGSRAGPCGAVRAGRWRCREAVLAGEAGEVEVVVHLEAKQHVLYPTTADLLAMKQTNVDGTEDWLRWCSRNHVRRFVYFSSIKAVQPASEGMTDEDAAGCTGSPYGASKWAAEALVRNWAKSDAGRSALILRPAVVYGPGSTANVAAMRTAIRRRYFFLVGENTNIKSMISIGNAVAATRFLMNLMRPGCEVYNLVDEESFPVREIDRRIRAQLGKAGNSPTLPLSIARAAARSGDIFHQLTGRVFPINSPRLEALMETTHFSCGKLQAAGFRHPQRALTDLG